MATSPRAAGLPRRWRRAALALALLLQALLLWIYYRPSPKGLVGDEVVYLRTARAIAAGEGAESELLRPTLYAHLLALLGVEPEHRLPIQALQIGLLAAAALLVRALTLHLFAAPLAADLAALVALLYPTLGAFAHYLWPEILHLTLWLGALTILASGRRGALWLGTAGLLIGLAILSRHLLLVFVPLVALALWLDSSERRASRVACLLAPILVLTAPSLWLDRAEDGRLRSASSARFNLWVGLNDTSRRSFEESIVYAEYQAYEASAATPAERDAILDAKLRALVAADGWPAILGRQLGKQYFRLFDKDTFFTDQLPGGALQGPQRGYRGDPGGLTTLLRWLDYTLYAALLALAAYGLAACRPAGSRWLQLVLAFLAYNLALFLLLHVKSRYRLQLTPFLLLFAAYGLDSLLAGAALAPARRWAAAGGAALLLFLAFGGSWL
jgi:hypothetical protein